MSIYPTFEFYDDVNNQALKLIMHMIIKDKVKIEAFANLLFMEAKKNPSLIRYFIKLVRKIGIENFKSELVHLWAEMMIELCHTIKQLHEIQIEIIEFFEEIINKESIKDLREDIFSFVINQYLRKNLIYH